ncbi:unnamed protein product [Linum trigynum]|uniref:Transmembrane protein n=1 Tax=Linum trigynum TaxID=586398 RepID=A0AAV2FAP4_9ROSI
MVFHKTLSPKPLLSSRFPPSPIGFLRRPANLVLHLLRLLVITLFQYSPAALLRRPSTSSSFFVFVFLLSSCGGSRFNPLSAASFTTNGPPQAFPGSLLFPSPLLWGTILNLRIPSAH